MLPAVTEFANRYNLENFIVVADSGLMNNDNIVDLEANGYKYIIGAKIKTESKKIKEWILSQPKNDCQMVEYDKGDGKRLLVGYTDDHARKDAYNREKGIRRLEKAYSRGTLTKNHINKRGYNKFLTMEGDVKVTIDYDKLETDAKWDGLKGVSYQYRHTGLAGICSMPQPMACGAGIPHIQVQNRDTSDVSLHPPTD